MVRGRPPQFAWPGSVGKPVAGSRMRILRWVMPLFVLAFIVRVLPREYWRFLGAALILSLLVGLVLWIRGGRRWDEAYLLLAVASKGPPGGARSPGGTGVPGTQGGEEVAVVLSKPASRRKLKLDAGTNDSVAVVGSGGHGLRQWLVGQAHALGVNLNVGLFDTLSETPTSTTLVVPARMVGSTSWCRQMERALTPGDQLASLVTFSEVVGRPFPAMIHGDWAKSRTQNDLVAAIGLGQEGKVDLNLEKEGPHALVVGGTGSGKSEFLSTMVLSLAATHSPGDLRFVFIDFKGGAGLDHLADLPHVEHSISDLDGTRVAWLLRALDKALDRRKRIMADLGARSWSEARGRGGDSRNPGATSGDVGPRLVVVVDEFQVLAEAHPDLMDRLTKLAAQGRSLGFHLILASQRPGGAITPALRSTLDLRVALRCTEKRDSIEVIGVGDAADLPRIPGRAIVRSRHVQLAFEPSVDGWISAIDEVWEDLGRHSGEDGAQKAVIPAALPDSVGHVGRGPEVASTLATAPTLVTGPALGVYESHVDSTLEPLVDRGGSVGIFGPRSHGGELAQLAAVFTTGLRTIWIGEAPPTMVGTQEVHDLRSRPDVELMPTDDLGAVVRTLVQITRGEESAQVVVIKEVSKLLARVESVVGVDQCASLWNGLVRSAARTATSVVPAPSPSAPAATQPWPAPSPSPSAKPWRLVVTDSKPRGELGELDVSLVRIPSRQTLLWGPLSGILPTQMPGAPDVPVVRPVDLEEFVSPLWGRVLVSGVVEEQTVWAQICLPPPPPVPLPPPEYLESPPLLPTPLPPPVRLPHSVQSIPFGTTVLKPALCEAQLESQLTTLVDRNIVSATFPAEAWPRLTAFLGQLLVMDPPKEVLRMLATRFPADAVWLQASFPLPSGSAIFTSKNGAVYLDAEQVLHLIAVSALDDTVENAVQKTA